MAFYRAGSGGSGEPNLFCEYYPTVESGNYIEIDVGFHPTTVLAYAKYNGADMISLYEESRSSTEAWKAQGGQYFSYPLYADNYANIYSVVGNIVKIHTNNLYAKLYLVARRD